MPPIPQEPPPEQEGRCPPSPFWTTRLPAKKRWWPVRVDKAWSKFTNRYAISPIPPLASRGSDGAGVMYTNAWEVDLPYKGFYGIKGTVDNFGKILIDGREVHNLQHFKNDAPDKTMVYLSAGLHEIVVQVENEKQFIWQKIDQKIFSTADWASKQTQSSEIIKGPKFVDVTFKASSSAAYANSITVEGLFSESKTYKGPQINSRTTAKVEIGKVYDVTVTSAQSRHGVRLRAKDGSILQMEEYTDNDWGDIQCSATQGKFYDFIEGANQSTCKFVVEGKSVNTGGLEAGVAKGGVTYSGPKLATYRSSGLGADLTPAWKDDIDYRANFMGKTWTSTWKNIYFPEDGQYDIKALADDTLSVKLDGVETVSYTHLTLPTNREV